MKESVNKVSTLFGEWFLVSDTFGLMWIKEREREWMDGWKGRKIDRTNVG